MATHLTIRAVRRHESMRDYLKICQRRTLLSGGQLLKLTLRKAQPIGVNNRLKALINLVFTLSLDPPRIPRKQGGL